MWGGSSQLPEDDVEIGTKGRIDSRQLRFSGWEITQSLKCYLQHVVPADVDGHQADMTAVGFEEGRGRDELRGTRSGVLASMPGAGKLARVGATPGKVANLDARVFLLQIPVHDADVAWSLGRVALRVVGDVIRRVAMGVGIAEGDIVARSRSRRALRKDPGKQEQKGGDDGQKADRHRNAAWHRSGFSLSLSGGRAKFSVLAGR